MLGQHKGVPGLADDSHQMPPMPHPDAVTTGAEGNQARFESYSEVSPASDCSKPFCEPSRCIRIKREKVCNEVQKLLQIQAIRDKCRRGRRSHFLISSPAKPSTTGICVESKRLFYAILAKDRVRPTSGSWPRSFFASAQSSRVTCGKR